MNVLYFQIVVKLIKDRPSIAGLAGLAIIVILLTMVVSPSDPTPPSPDHVDVPETRSEETVASVEVRDCLGTDRNNPVCLCRLGVFEASEHADLMTVYANAAETDGAASAYFALSEIERIHVQDLLQDAQAACPPNE